MSEFVHFSTQKSNPNMPGVKDVEPKEVWEKKSQLMVIDVRRPDEVAEHGYIPGAMHVVLDTLPLRLEEIPREKTLVFVCQLGGRSARACAFLTAQGFTHVVNMKGGMSAWTFDVEGKS